MKLFGIFVLVVLYTFGNAQQCRDNDNFPIKCRFLRKTDCDKLRHRIFFHCRFSCNWCDDEYHDTTTTTTTTPATTTMTPTTPKVTTPSRTTPIATITSTKTTTTPEATAPSPFQGPEWSEWTKGPCSVTCGNDQGEQVTERTCSTGNNKDCKGKHKRTRKCFAKIKCPAAWGEWSDSGCQTHCGAATRKFTRKCTTEGQCVGRSSRAEDCFNYCDDVEKLDWSDCSATCGVGFRSRQECDDEGNCTTIWSDCQDKECPKVDCVAESKSGRYRQESKCCENLNNSPCGNPMAKLRIIGGTTAERWPWAGHMTFDSPIGKQLCGFSLIHKDWVITAGHCVQYDMASMELYLGTTKFLGSNSKEEIQKLGVSNVILHPQYNSTNLFADIALLKLSESAQFNDRVYSICLPHGEEIQPGTTCIAVGWGIFDLEQPGAADDLLEVKLYSYPYEVCLEKYTDSPYFGSMNGKQICSGLLSGSSDTCRGDSGGPLMCQRCNSCQWYVAGLTSFGAINCGITEKPGVYTKVNAYTDWINSEIPELKSEAVNCNK